MSALDPPPQEEPDFPELRDATLRAREGCLADMPEDNLNLEEWLQELRKWRLLSRPGRFTGLLDFERFEICVGDLLLCGMRRGDSKGWTPGYVEFAPARPDRTTGLYLRSTKGPGGGHEMQYDQELRAILRFRKEQMLALSHLSRTDIEYKQPIPRRVLDELLAFGMISGWNYATPINWGRVPQREMPDPRARHIAPQPLAVETSARLAKVRLTEKGKRTLAVAALKRES